MGFTYEDPLKKQFSILNIKIHILVSKLKINYEDFKLCSSCNLETNCSIVIHHSV